MEFDSLIHLANRIGLLFASMPDRAEALECIAEHIQYFWERRARAKLLEHVDAKDGIGLDTIVLDALQAHRAILL
ncbi:MAG: formate dehydrogenase subunit delta [Betaproteobacteria bacterium]|jgi:formate dehydrogenase subunit delta|uniref:NAD-dependent formate dehydrogenase delta subunit n=1 Tax=Thiomonas delicata TaxID=364030 RepID=A0A238D7W0_THIDL|nr:MULTISPECIES: formate dehydrogenase subunit delta [Thiomonas]MDE2130215.1 formate dehydrogenase subunit delta [Betaproteobacteria bacterium]OZB44639.1 MAG: formate dehydrogenase [Thiomonas sp. 15-66-11]OZB51489.1 MAG: formate dehydrogenase [Thiomonas sp. 14-66-4]OZB62462.1 MAG: formate dehydrogenase [Thiomonas sp. 13-66-29]SBP89309.1 NAD-dependent formate dehydrogenase delta subunit [Thiomonas delicata]